MKLSRLFLAPTLLSGPARHASKNLLRYSSTSTQGHTHMPGNFRTSAVFPAGFSWHVPYRNEERYRAAGTVHRAGLPSRRPGAKGGKLMLRIGGSAFLLWHPAAAAVAPWSTPLALQTLTEQELAGVEKEGNITGTASLCFAHEEAEPCVSCTGSRRLLGKFSPKGKL